MDQVLASDILVSEFDSFLHNDDLFRTNTLWEKYKPSYPPKLRVK